MDPTTQLAKDQLLASTIVPTHHLTHPLTYQNSQPPPSNMDTHLPISPLCLLPAHPATCCTGSQLSVSRPASSSFTYPLSFLTPSHLPSLTIYFHVTQENLSLPMYHPSGSTHPLTNVYPITHHSPESTDSPTKVKPPIYGGQLTTCQSRKSAHTDPSSAHRSGFKP